MVDDDDPLGCARGFVFILPFAVLFWVLVGCAVWWYF